VAAWHLGVQFARQMGSVLVAIGRGREKEKLAKDLARKSTSIVAARMPQRCCNAMAGARAILATELVVMHMGPLVAGLASRGKLIIVGVSNGPKIRLECFPLSLEGARFTEH